MNYSEAGEFPDEAEEQDHDEDDADLKKRPGTIDSTVIEGEPIATGSRSAACPQR